MEKKRIWEPREETFAIKRYIETGDKGWIKDLIPRKFFLKGYIPLMITNIGEMVCIPETVDTPSILLTGARGSGKTSVKLSILGSVYHHMGWNACDVNDMTRETFTHHKRQSVKDTVKGYWDFRRPKMLPLIHLSLMSNKLRKEVGVPDWQLALPFKDVIEKPEEYLGMDKMASASYLSNLKSKFENTPKHELTLEKIEDTIYDSIAANSPKIAPAVTSAIMLRIKRLYNDGILDICPDNEKADSEIALLFPGEEQYIKFNVISGLMAVGGIPVIHTDNIIHEPRFLKSYLSNLIEKVIKDQESHPFFKGKKLMIFIDELTTISGRGNENPIIYQLVAQGRPKGIGTCYCTQNPSMLEPAILSNTKYFLTCQNTNIEAKILVKEFGLEDRYVDNIVHLDKNYKQCLAYTQEKFMIFNPKENMMYEDSGPFIGEFIHPTAGSRPPRMQ